ncbi:glycosyltransferase [Nostoc sp. LEGE 12447]|nr:glycosyltransferase [Nostoc sp. LEGE 12447]
MSQFMNIFIYVVVGYFFILIITQYIAIKNSERFIDSQLNFEPRVLQKQVVCHNRRKLVLIIPVLEEENVVERTIQHFKNILNKEIILKIIFVTTEKEGSPEENATFQKINPHVNENIFIEHYPHKDGNKADQINYVVIKYAENKEYDNISTYYGIFDADSLPDIRGFEYLLTDNSDDVIYQMFSVYSTNCKNLNLFNKASAVFQTRWTMSYELSAAIENYIHKKVSHFSYTIGHGLFVRKDYMENNPFSSGILAEDILFGYTAISKGICIKPIPFFDYCSSSSSLSIHVQQSARWYAGDLFSLLKVMKHSIKNRDIKYITLQLKRLFHILQWSFGPLIISLVIVLSLSNQKIWNLIMVFITMFLYIFLIHAPIIKRFFKSEDISRNIYIALVFKSFVNCAGPLYSNWVMISGMLGYSKELSFKTPKS